jgi:hypothetical protein
MQQAAAAATAAITLAAAGTAPGARPRPFAAPALRLLAAAGGALQGGAPDALVEPVGELLRAAGAPGLGEEARGLHLELLPDLAAAAGCLGAAQAQPQARPRRRCACP